MVNSNIFTSNTAGDSVQFLLLLAAIILAILGNGAVCCLLLRFKTLRTIPNLLVLDLSIVDGLNVVLNGTLFAAYFVVEVDVLHGRVTAVFTEASYRVFLFLNLTTKLLMMLDRYFVITHGVRYTAWKSRPKVLLILGIKWVFCLAIGIGSTRALWKIDLGDAQVLEYRSEYLETNGKMIKRLTIIINHALYTCLAMATFYSVVKTNKELKSSAKKGNSALVKVNNSSKVKASKTIVIIVFCDFVFYMPMLMYLYMVLVRGFQKHGWFPFFAHFFVFVSSLNNPIIYFSRTQRFRMALIKMLRDPCGSSEIFELRTLPEVKVVHQKRGRRTHTEMRVTQKSRARGTLDTFEKESHIGPVDIATTQPGRGRGSEHERASGARSPARIDDHPLAFVHWSATGDDDGSKSKQVHREVKVILANRSSTRGGKSDTEGRRGNKTRASQRAKGAATKASETSSAYFSEDYTQGSGQTVTYFSEDSLTECYDTRL